MEKRISDICQYGQLVCDFVNADTIDKATIGLLKNISHTFGYYGEFEKLSNKFEEKIVKLRCNLTQTEEILFDLIMRSIETQCVLDDFDKEVSPYNNVESYIEIKDGVFEDKLLLAEQIEHIGNEISNTRYCKIEKLAMNNNKFIDRHYYVPFKRFQLKKYLENILSNENWWVTQYLLDSHKGHTMEDFFGENDLIFGLDMLIDGGLWSAEIPSWLEREGSCILDNWFERVWEFCLVEFLRDEKNKSRLKKCNICNKFFIAKDTKRGICYNIECKRREGRLRTTYNRETDPVKYGPLNPDNETLKDPLYQERKAIWEVEAEEKKKRFTK